MRAERPVDNWRIIPPPQREAPDGYPRGHADEPTGALGPAEGSLGRIHPGVTIGNIPPLPQREASGMPGPRPRALGAPSSTTSTVGTATPTRVIGTDARCRQPAWDISTDARYIPLAVTTTPSQCRQPPRGADNTRPCGTRHCPASPLGESPGLVPLPPVTHTRTPIYETPDAHNGLIPPLCATPCFLIPSLVCDTKKNACLGR